MAPKMTKAERKAYRKEKGNKKAQANLKSKIKELRPQVKQAKADGQPKGNLQQKLDNKIIKRNKNMLDNANAAGNSERVGRIEKRLDKVKTRRNDRREESFNSQSPETAADFDFAKHSSKKVGTKELGHLVRDKDFSKADVAAAAQNSGLKIGDKAQKRLDKWASAKDKVNGTKVTPTPEPTPTPTPTPPRFDKPITQPYKPQLPVPQPTPTPTPNPNNTQDTDYTQELNVQSDNDISSDVTGDNNSIYNWQDNSIRNYGGDVRTFNYQSNGNGSGLDSPVSAATMGGFYSPSDSHGANAARLDRRVTQANDFAKDNMNTSNFAQGAIDNAAKNRMVNPAMMHDLVSGMGSATKADAYLMGANIYGDIGSYKPNWQQPNTIKPLEMPKFG